MIEIILKAVDQASSVFKQNEQAVKKFGDAAKEANQKANSANKQLQQSTGLTGKEINHLSVKLREVGEKGKSSFDKLSQSEQDSLIKFNMLDKASQNLLMQVNKVGNANFSGLSGAINDAKSKFQSLNGYTKTWSGSLDYSRSKLQLLGTDTDSLKGKIQVFGSAITTYVSPKIDSIKQKWDSLKSKTTEVASSIKTHLVNAANAVKSKFGEAIESVKTKVQSLADKFSGLGGVVSSVFGGIGLKGVYDMTVGMSLNRDRVLNLSHALLGADQSLNEFKNDSDGLWAKMDADTTASLVSLDELAQALSVVKMSTGATTEQMAAFEPVLVDIGQRAILMGRSGDEAMALMTAAGKGLNGEFEMLRENLGITKEDLINAGWDGTAEDIEGYTKALEHCLESSGDVSDMMNTTTGKLTTLEKYWRIAGRSIGDKFLPYIDKALDKLNELAKPTKDGSMNLAQYAIGIIGVASGFATLAPTIAPVLQVLDHVNLSILTSPWMWLVAVLALVGVAVYEVGVSFGWWSDISTMIFAISDGIRRLWEAFSNSPVVRQEIENLKTDFFNLLDAIKGLGGVFSDWFDLPEGKFDIVHSIITFFEANGPIIQQEVQNIRTEIITVLGIIQGIWTAISPYVNIPGIIENIRVFFETWGGTILQLIRYALILKVAFAGYNYIKSIVQGVKGKFDSLKNTIISVKDKLQDTISSAKDKLDSLRDKVDNVKGKFDKLKETINGVKDKLGSFASKIKEIAVSKVNALKDAFRRLADSISLAAIKEKLYALWQGIVNGLTAVWNALLAVNPVVWVVIAIGALVAILIYLYNTNETVRNGINWLWEQLQGLGQWLMDTLVPAWNGLMETLQPVYDFLVSVFTPVWDALVDIWNSIVGIVGNVTSAFDDFKNGQMDLPSFILTILTSLWNIYVSIYGRILTLVIQFATNMFNYAITTGRNIVVGIVTWLSQLPGRAWAFLMLVLTNIINAGVMWINKARAAAMQIVSGVMSYLSSLPGRALSALIGVVSSIVSAGSQWLSNAITVATNMVNGIMDRIKELPGKIYDEFMNIGARIMSAGSDLYNKACEIGKNIVDGLLGAMGIHSPGTIQTKVVDEFKNMVGKIQEWIKPAGETAKEMGETIVDEFGDPSFGTNADSLVQELSQNPNMNLNLGVDSSQLDVANQDVITKYDSLASSTGLSLQNMVTQDKTAFDNIRTNDTTQMSIISTTVGNRMLQMTNSVKTNMKRIVSQNKTGFNNVKTNTALQLNQMVTKTRTANELMIQSWNYMRDGIISAANTIRSDSTNHFTQLGNTIGGFYRKLRNPSSWGAGGPSGSSRGSSSRGFGKITQAIQNASLPTYLTLGQIRSNPLLDSSNFGDYVLRNPKTNRFSVTDLIDYGIIKLVGKGAGDYDSIPSPNIKLIKDTSNEWDMKGPLVGRYSTNKGFKVKDFLTGIPNISFDEFRSIAEDVYSQTQYEFYYDDNHHGNWLNAFNAGSMNCKHGAESLIALANVFGFSGSMVHGHWNKFGHYWANIAGHKMDVTGWQQRRTWTPSASAGPAPKGMGFDEFVNAIKQENPATTATQNMNNDNVDVSGNVTVEHVHKFIDLPENISAEEVARLINEAPEDDNWLLKLIKKIVRDKNFQNLDLKQKSVLDGKNRRARGI